MPLNPSQKQDNKIALQKAQEAADIGDNIGMVQWLFNSLLLEGYVIYFRSKYSGISSDDIHYVISAVIDKLSTKISKGDKVNSIGGYISKVVDCRLIDYVNNQSLHINYDVENIGTKHTSDKAENLDKLRDAIEIRQKQLFSAIENLIPRLNIGRVQEVMKYIFGAVKNGAEDVTHQDIADALNLPVNSVGQYKKRGFDRLARIAKEENLVDQSFNFSLLEETKYFLENDIETDNDRTEIEY